MKSKLALSGLVALALSAFTANACWNVSGVVSCPNGNTAAGIVLNIPGVGSTTTTGNGAFFIDLPSQGTYTICIDESTLPAGASVSSKSCVKFSVDNIHQFADINFTLKGAFCETPPPPGPCWLTGGGTIDKGRGVPPFSYGGVVNPGCSPVAAGGGNWNVVDHARGLHFKGIDIVVIQCSGVPTKSPRVNVNIIDFMGTGTLTGVDGNPMPETAVSFIARAIDASEPGAGKDALYLNVFGNSPSTSLMLISTDSNPETVAPVTITTGNLQIHTTSCK